MNTANLYSILRYAKFCGSSRKLIFYEKGTEALLKKVTIKGLQQNNTLMITFPGSKEYSHYFTNNGDHNKRCDGVIVTEYNQQLYIIYLEIKSTSINMNYVRKQYLGTECFIQYCKSILELLLNDELLENCNKRYVLFHYPLPIRKTVTRTSRASNLVSSPSRPLKVPYNKPLRIRKLV